MDITTNIQNIGNAMDCAQKMFEKGFYLILK
jgi:hypothetical protein